MELLSVTQFQVVLLQSLLEGVHPLRGQIGGGFELLQVVQRLQNNCGSLAPMKFIMYI